MCIRDSLIRTYNSMIWGRRDISSPGLIAKNERSPLGIGWTMHLGSVSNPFGTGSSNRFLPDNPVVIMPDGSRHVFYKDKNDSTRFISKEFWIYKLISGGSGSGTWELTLTDGTVYTFQYGTGAAGYNVVDDFNTIIDKVAQVTKIRNAANTASINISYYIHTNGYSYLKTITDSANRTVTLNYDYTAHRLTSITVDSRTFNYGYITINGNNHLTSLTPPVGNAWTYGYETSSNTYELNSITYPTGGVINYAYDDVWFKTGTTNVKFRVVDTRTTSGRNINGGTWTYSYSSGGSSGDSTTISAPGVTETHTYYGWGNTNNGTVWKVGLPISKSYTGNLSQSESYDWSQGTQISDDQIANANWSSTGGQIYDTAVYVPFMSSKSITRDSRTYATSYSSFNTYGDPQSTSETGEGNRSRTLGYFTNSSKNIVKGKPSSETVTGSFTGTSTSSWNYDSNSGNVTHMSKDGVSTDYGYDANGNLSSVTDANSHQTTYLWTYGKISQETNPIYHIPRSINSNGTVASETNGRGYTTNYGYDGNLRLTSIAPPVGNTTSFSYPSDSSSKTESRGGYSISYYYDGFGRASGSSDSRGVTTSIAYTAYGFKDYSDSNIGDRVNFDYFGRVEQIIHKDNFNIGYSYSGGNVSVTDENNRSITLNYDAFGNPDEKYLMSVQDQEGNSTSYTRNIRGQVTNISQGSVNRSFGYNSKYFLTSENHPETDITYSRDNVGNMTSRTDSNGSLSYTYDSINRLTNMGSISFGYDNANNRTSANSPAASLSFTYDTANRITQKSESLSGGSFTIGFGYDGNDSLTSLTYPSGRVITYGYNSNNQATSITGFGGSLSSVVYNTAGFPTSYSRSNTKNPSLSYNSRNLTTAISAGSALSVGYGYDTRGNTTSMTNSLDTSKNQSFSYDDLSRLTSFSGAWGSGSLSYDDYGNRTGKTVAGIGTTYGYSSNRLTSTTGGEPASYSYNGNGTLSSGTWQGTNYSLSYDVFNNVDSISSGGSTIADFSYDADGLRVAKTAGGKTTVYHYDHAGKLLTETDGSGGFIADYIYFNGKLAAKVANDAYIIGTPANLTATADSPTTISLSWTDNATNETGFIVERRTASGSYAQITTTAADVTTYSDSGLTANITYYYRVKAGNAVADSEYSNEANALTPSANAPQAPSGATANPLSSTQVAISWNDNSNDETQFVIERKAAGGSFAQVGTLNANITTYTDTGLSPNTLYYYRVKAANAAGASIFSNEASATTLNLDAPSDLVATAVSASAITLLWMDNSSNETSFLIERKTGTAGAYAQIGTVAANVTTFSDTGLPENTLYYYRVRASNDLGSSPYATESNTTTWPTTVPSAPSGLTATTVSSIRISLSWFDNSDNEAAFVIERKTGEAGTYAPIATLGLNVTSYSDTGLTKNTTYYYRVKATNVVGPSAYSNEANATTLNLDGPSGLTATSVTSMKITLSWTDNSTDESGFAIERKTGEAGTYAEVARVGANVATYSDNNLSQNTQYFYRVKSFNGTGYSPYSNEVNPTTLVFAAPSGLTVTAGNTLGLVLNWTDNTGDETGFRIDRKTGAGGTYSGIAAVATNITSYDDTTIQPGTVYYYRVRAYSYNFPDNYYTPYSNEVSGTQNPASAPSGLAIASPSDSMGLVLTWTDNTSDETGFRIERKTGLGGTYSEIGAVATANVTTYDDTAIQPGTIYYYRVRAYSYRFPDNYYTPYSNEVNGVKADIVAPSDLTLITLNRVGIVLAWTDTTSDETGFIVERKTGVGGTYSVIGSVTSNVTTYDDVSVQAGVQYYYRIRAYSNVNFNNYYSPYSNESSGVQGTTGAPSGLTSVPGINEVTLSWTDNSLDETHFAIERKIGESGTYSMVNFPPANLTTYNDTGLSPSTTYYYRVRAYATTGYAGTYSPYSNEINTTTYSNQPVKVIGGSSYTTLQGAYNASIDGDVLQIYAIILAENLELNRPITATISGGYDASYSTVVGMTTLNGLTVVDGAAIVDNVINNGVVTVTGGSLIANGLSIR